MDKWLRAQAEMIGGGSTVASRRYSNLVDTVAQKYKAHLDELPNAPEPTANELTALRERYLEHRALEERSQLLWRLLKEDHRVEIAAICLKMAYRFTLFAAAVVILWRAVRPYIST